MKNFVFAILEVRYNALGFTPMANEDHLTTLGRLSVSSWMCKFDDDDCVRKAQTYYNKWMTDGDLIPADIKEVVFEVPNQHGRYVFKTFKKFNS